MRYIAYCVVAILFAIVLERIVFAPRHACERKFSELQMQAGPGNDHSGQDPRRPLVPGAESVNAMLSDDQEVMSRWCPCAAQQHLLNDTRAV